MKILGQIGKLEPTITMAVFLGALIVIILIEKLVDVIEEWCTENRYEIVFTKLQSQLMNLGIISFVVFAVESFSNQSTIIHDALHPFEFTHIVLLSIAIAFVCQSILLVRHSIHESKSTLMSLREPSNSLKDEFDNMMRNPKSRVAKSFLEYPSWMALFHMIPMHREHIENKIMERFFMKIHKLPSNFDFAKYLYYLFQSYIVSLGQVSTFGWVLIMVFVVVNYFRLMVIDPAVSDCVIPSSSAHSGDDHYADDHHTDDHATDDHATDDHATDDHAADDHATDDHHTDDHAADDHATDDHATDDHATDDHHTDDHATDDHTVAKFVIRKVFSSRRALSMALSVPVRMSNYVARRLSAAAEGDDGLDDGFDCIDRYVLSFAIFCAILLCLYILLVYILANVYYDRMIEVCGKVGFTGKFSFQKESGGRANYGKCLDELIQLENSHEIDHSILSVSTKAVKNPKIDTNGVKSLPELLKSAKREVARETHEEIVLRNEPFIVQAEEFAHEVIHGYERQFEQLEWHEANGPNPYKDLFVGNIPGMFFLAVELSVFVQCFYIAIWATQILPIAKQSAEAGGWIVILSIPVVLNFFIVRHILVMAVMLKGFIELDHKLVAHVCQDLIEEAERLDQLGRRVRSKHKHYNAKFSKLNIPLPPIIILIHMLNQHIKGRSFEFRKVEFRKFLGKHGMFLDHDQFRAIWSCIDANLSGSISWDEIFITVFPEMQESTKKLVLISEKLRAKCHKEHLASLVGFRKKCSKFFQRFNNEPVVSENDWRIFLDNIAKDLEVEPGVISINKFYRMVCDLRVFEGNTKHATFNKFFADVMPTKTDYEPEESSRAGDGLHDVEFNKKHSCMSKQEFILLVDPVYYYQVYVTLPDDVDDFDEEQNKSFSFSHDDIEASEHSVNNAHASENVHSHAPSGKKTKTKEDSDSDASDEGEDSLNSPFTTVKHHSPSPQVDPHSTRSGHQAHHSHSHGIASQPDYRRAPVVEVRSQSPSAPPAVPASTGAAGNKSKRHNIPTMDELRFGIYVPPVQEQPPLPPKRVELPPRPATEGSFRTAMKMPVAVVNSDRDASPVRQQQVQQQQQRQPHAVSFPVSTIQSKTSNDDSDNEMFEV